MQAWKSLDVKCFFHLNPCWRENGEFVGFGFKFRKQKAFVEESSVKTCDVFTCFVEESRCENWWVCFLTQVSSNANRKPKNTDCERNSVNKTARFLFNDFVFVSSSFFLKTNKKPAENSAQTVPPGRITLRSCTLSNVRYWCEWVLVKCEWDLVRIGQAQGDGHLRYDLTTVYDFNRIYRKST